jgi:hypothetical protein
MNSRAAYDEDEVLRKVLEESKTEGSVVDSGSRRGKRARDDSEEYVASLSLYFNPWLIGAVSDPTLNASGLPAQPTPLHTLKLAPPSLSQMVILKKAK